MKTNRLWALCPAFLLLTATQGTAATIYVTTADVTAATGCNLYDAIVAAETDSPSGNCNAGLGADEIVLEQEIYALYPPTNSSNLSALPEITTTITLSGSQSTIRRHDASDVNTYVGALIQVSEGGVLHASQLTLDEAWQGGLVIDGGMASLDNVTITNQRVGGVLLQNYGELTLNNSEISYNDGGVHQRVGGIEIRNGSTLKIYHSQINNNAGGIAHGFGDGYGISPNTAINTITIDNSKIQNNGSRYLAGINLTNTVLTVNNSEITGNSAINAAAISVLDESAIFNNSIIANNDTDFGGAGGIVAGANTEIRNSIVHNNRCRNCAAGGILAAEGSIIENTTISYNKGIYAGGVVTTGHVVIKNSTIAENTMKPQYEDPNQERRFSGGIASNVNANVSENPITLQNTIVANNHGGYWQCAEDLTADSGNNYVSDGSCDALYTDDESPFLDIANSELVAHMQLQPTHIVATGGNINTCTVQDAESTERLTDGNCSLGALESTITATTSDDSESSTVSTGNDPSSETASESNSDADTVAARDSTAVLSSGEGEEESDSSNSDSQNSGGGALNIAMLLLVANFGFLRRRRSLKS